MTDLSWPTPRLLSWISIYPKHQTESPIVGQETRSTPDTDARSTHMPITGGSSTHDVDNERYPLASAADG